MIRKLSRKLSQTRVRQEDNDDFASQDARAHDRAREAPPRAAAPVAAAPFAQYSFEGEAGFGAPMGRTIDALQLEPIIAPTLQRMRPFVAPAETLLPDAPPRRGSLPMQSLVPQPLARPPVAHVPIARLDRDAVVLARPVPGITVTPADDVPDPMEALDVVTPLPSRQRPPPRPLLRRNALSYRDQRDIPLRVQAVRRAHQEEYARQISQRPLLAQVPRRGSEPVLQHRARAQHTPDVRGMGPPPTPAPTRLLPPVPHNPHLNRRGSSSRVEHLDRPRLGRGNTGRRRDYFAEQPQQDRDWYLEAAAAEWNIADDLQHL